MNRTEYLVQRLSEECSEVAVECSKANLYGLEDHYPDDPAKRSNRQRIIDELNDLLGVVSVLVREGILPDDWQDTQKQAEKTRKVAHYMRYSRLAGTLSEPVDGLYFAIWSPLINEVIGTCSDDGRADVEQEEPGSEFRPISKEEYDYYGDDYEGAGYWTTWERLLAYRAEVENNFKPAEN